MFKNSRKFPEILGNSQKSSDCSYKFSKIHWNSQRCSKFYEIIGNMQIFFENSAMIHRNSQKFSKNLKKVQKFAKKYQEILRNLQKFSEIPWQFRKFMRNSQEFFKKKSSGNFSKILYFFLRGRLSDFSK